LIGKTLGHYEIVDSLGVGGMGEVYRARDTNLKRDVAIKVLPAELASDDERLARLEREAHLLASLNHPNIAAIYNLEESGGVRWLVLELVEGENLEQRLQRGRLSVEDSLAISRQVAVAIDAAHKKGIVHRDLKPANVMVTRDGVAKVLDFGIAKAPMPAGAEGSVEGDAAEDLPGASRVTRAITNMAAHLTATGMLVGTVPYMSPEQIRGGAVDKRSDIWAFGCLMFEMLSGQRPFPRETMADTLSAILEHEPAWEALPSGTPASVRELIQRCLTKDADMRLQDIADGRVSIDETTQSGKMPALPQGAAAAGNRFRISKRAAAGGAALFVIASMLVAYFILGDDVAGAPWPASLRVAVAEGSEGAYGRIANGIGELIEQEIGISIERQDPRDYPSVADGLRRVDAGELDLVIVQNDAAFNSVWTADFLGHESDNIVGLAALYPELLHVVVPADSGITTIDELRGKTIAIGDGFGASSSTALLSRFDINEADFVPNPLGGEEVLQGGWESADVIMQWASVPATYLAGALRGGTVNLVSIDPDVVGGLQANWPFFKPAVIPSRAYPRQAEAVPTVAVTAILVANSRIPADLVERVLEVMFANISYLIAKHPRAADISLVTAFGRENGMAIPLHPGAEAFREAHAAEIGAR